MSGATGQGGRFSELSFLAKHSVIYGIGNMLSRIVAFVMLPIYTRHLTPFDYGVLEIVDTTVSIIGLVAGLGIAGAMSRFYFEFNEEAPRRAVVGTIFLLTFATAGVLIGLLWPFSGLMMQLLFERQALAHLLEIALLSLGLGLLIDIAQVYLRIQQASLAYVAMSLGNLLVGVGLNIYLIVFRDLGVQGIFYASLMAKVVVGVPLVLVVLRRVGLHFDAGLAKRMYRYALPLIPSDLANTIIGYSDRYFINHFMSTAEAGIYGLAQKLGTVVHLLITSPFLLTYLPRRFEIAKAPDAPRTFASVFDYHLLVLVMISTALALFARELLVVMTTAPFYAAADLIPVIAFGMVVLGMKYHFQFGILYSNQTQYQMYINLLSAALHLGLNAVLVPWLGVWGALIASTVALSSNTVLSLVFARALYPIPYQFGRTLRLLLLAAATVVLALSLAPAGWAGVAVKAVLLGAFVVAVAVGGVVPRAERARIREMVANLWARVARS